MTLDPSSTGPGDGADPLTDLGDSFETATSVPGIPGPRPAPGVWPPKPGIFAAVWPVYLLLGAFAAASPFMSARYVDDTIALPAVRMIVAAFVLGLTVLLPLVRLSQSRSPDPVVESAMDAFSLLLPVQPVIWFTVVRPIDLDPWRVLATDLSMIGWTSLVAAIVGLTLARERSPKPDPVRRTLGMLLVLGLQGLGPGVAAILWAFGAGGIVPLEEFGPVASVVRLLGEPRSVVALESWTATAAVWLLSIGVWWIALAERRKVLSCGERAGGLASGS